MPTSEATQSDDVLPAAGNRSLAPTRTPVERARLETDAFTPNIGWWHELPFMGRFLRERELRAIAARLTSALHDRINGGRLSLSVLNDSDDVGRTLLAAYLAAVAGHVSNERVFAAGIGKPKSSLETLLYDNSEMLGIPVVEDSKAMLQAVTQRPANRYGVKAAGLFPADHARQAEAAEALLTCLRYIGMFSNVLVVDAGWPQEDDSLLGHTTATVRATETSVFVATAGDQASMNGCARSIELMRQSSDAFMNDRLNSRSVLVVLGAERLETDTFGERFGFHGKVLTVPWGIEELQSCRLDLPELPSDVEASLLSVLVQTHAQQPTPVNEGTTP